MRTIPEERKVHARAFARDVRNGSLDNALARAAGELRGAAEGAAAAAAARRSAAAIEDEARQMARDAAASANDIALGGMTTPPPRALGGARLEVLASCRARVRSHSPATPSPPSWCALPCGSMAWMRTRLARAWPSFSMATTFHAASTVTVCACAVRP